MTAQASAAGYGTFAVGKAAKIYLERGCTWGPAGISATLAEILGETDASLTLARLRHEIQTDLLAISPGEQGTLNKIERS